jgi:DNA helicase II / ATP-dependent DNA helicase PcrA
MSVRRRSTDLSSLNPEQYEAVTHVRGPMLVLAGAGSGKTRVITFRVSHLIDLGVPPEHIVALSFTNKAAGEMRERAAKMIGADIAKRAWLSTFHSMGAQILREHIQHLGYQKPYTIMDSGDQLRLVKDVIAELSRTKRHFRDLDPKRIHAVISRAKNDFCEPARLKSLKFDKHRPFAQTVYKRYVDALKALNAVDFDDLITLPVKLMEEVEQVRESIRNRCRFVMVDEYQDTNETQLRMLKVLVNPENNICAVGDDDQSIYGFRGAVADNILGFGADFAGAKVVKLEQNYRSTSSILDAANAVIGENTKRHPKQLWSALGAGSPPRFVLLPNDTDEADHVASDIRRKQRAREGKWDDYAVLFRTASQARPLEESLRALDIPYRLIGGTKFFDRREVKDVVAYLRVILNPRDEVSLRRIINVPRRGIGPGALTKLAGFAHRIGRPLRDAIARAGEIEELSPNQRQSLVDLDRTIRSARKEFHSQPLAQAARNLLDRLQFESWLNNQRESAKITKIRIDNVEEIVSSLTAFEDQFAGGGRKALDAYLARLTLDGKPDQPDEPPGRRKGEVTLMTLHGSKGLEFPDVYLVGFEEGLLPHARSVMPGADGGVEEERRLAYVGMTRAKRELVLTAARLRGSGGRRHECKPSRFLREIPGDLLAQGECQAEEEAVENRKARMKEMRALLFDD